MDACENITPAILESGGLPGLKPNDFEGLTPGLKPQATPKDRAFCPEEEHFAQKGVGGTELRRGEALVVSG